MEYLIGVTNSYLSAYTKINARWIKNPHMKEKIQLFEKIIKGLLHDFGKTKKKLLN